MLTEPLLEGEAGAEALESSDVIETSPVDDAAASASPVADAAVVAVAVAAANEAA